MRPSGPSSRRLTRPTFGRTSHRVVCGHVVVYATDNAQSWGIQTTQKPRVVDKGPPYGTKATNKRTSYHGRTLYNFARVSRLPTLRAHTKDHYHKVPRHRTPFSGGHSHLNRGGLPLGT